MQDGRRGVGRGAIAAVVILAAEGVALAQLPVPCELEVQALARRMGDCEAGKAGSDPALCADGPNAGQARIDQAMEACAARNRACAPPLPCQHLEAYRAQLARAGQDTRDVEDALLDCRNGCEARADAREHAAADRPLEEILAIPEAQRTPAERERLEAVAFSRDVFAFGRDPAAFRQVASAVLCWEGAQLEEAQALLRRARRGTAVGGVVHLRSVYELQEEIVTRRDRLAHVRRALARQHLKPAACAEPEVSAVACLAPSTVERPGCVARPMRVRLAYGEQLR